MTNEATPLDQEAHGSKGAEETNGTNVDGDETFHQNIADSQDHQESPSQSSSVPLRPIPEEPAQQKAPVKQPRWTPKPVDHHQKVPAPSIVFPPGFFSRPPPPLFPQPPSFIWAPPPVPLAPPAPHPKVMLKDERPPVIKRPSTVMPVPARFMGQVVGPHQSHVDAMRKISEACIDPGPRPRRIQEDSDMISIRIEGQPDSIRIARHLIWLAVERPDRFRHRLLPKFMRALGHRSGLASLRQVRKFIRWEDCAVKTWPFFGQEILEEANRER